MSTLSVPDEPLRAPHATPLASVSALPLAALQPSARERLAALTAARPTTWRDESFRSRVGDLAWTYYTERGASMISAVTRGVYTGGPGTDHPDLPDVSNLPSKGDRAPHWSSHDIEHAKTTPFIVIPLMDDLGHVTSYNVRFAEENEVETGKQTPVTRTERHECHDATGAKRTISSHEAKQGQHQCRDAKGEVLTKSETRARKFTFPVGAARSLDTRHLPDRSNTAVVVLTEGVVRADALADAIEEASGSIPDWLGIVAVSGVDAPVLGSNNDENDTGIPQVSALITQMLGKRDLEGITVVFAADADAYTNANVRAAMSRAAFAFTQAGAEFGVLVTPSDVQFVAPSPDGADEVEHTKHLGKKAGIDDWIAANHAHPQNTLPLGALLADYHPAGEWGRLAKNYGDTDCARGERLADELHARRSRFVDGTHYVWTGTHLAEDKHTQPMLRRLAQRCAKHAAMMHEDHNAVASSAITNAIREASADRRLTRSSADLNRYLDSFIPLPNGMLCINSWTIIPHDPERFANTFVLAHPYDPESPARSATFTKFLDESFTVAYADGSSEVDYDTMETVQMHLGRDLLFTSHETFAIWQGAGLDGKSTLEAAVRHAIGLHVTGTLGAELLTGKADKFTLSNVRNKCLVFFNETKESAEVDDGLIKQLASRDHISSEEKHKNAEEHRPTHGSVLLTNHLPKLRMSAGGVDERKGFWRRILLVPWRNPIPSEQDERYDDLLLSRLEAEAEAVLAWLMEGLRKWLDNGRRLKVSAACVKAKADWQASTDPLGQFIADCLKKDPKGEIDRVRLFALYEEHCRVNQRKAMGKKNFFTAMYATSRLGECAEWKVDKRSVRGWKGWTEADDHDLFPTASVTGASEPF